MTIHVSLAPELQAHGLPAILIVDGHIPVVDGSPATKKAPTQAFVLSEGDLRRLATSVELAIASLPQEARCRPIPSPKLSGV